MVVQEIIFNNEYIKFNIIKPCIYISLIKIFIICNTNITFKFIFGSNKVSICKVLLNTHIYIWSIQSLTL
jgi:hypothetical protein